LATKRASSTPSIRKTHKQKALVIITGAFYIFAPNTSFLRKQESTAQYGLATQPGYSARLLSRGDELVGDGLLAQSFAPLEMGSDAVQGLVDHGRVQQVGGVGLF
jgi:hypothetical protein